MIVTLEGQARSGGWTRLHRTAEAGYWIGSSHRHREWEVNLMLHGSASCIAGTTRHLLTPGSLLWLCPSNEHMLVEESSDFAMWVAVFTPKLVKQTADDLAPADVQQVRIIPPASQRQLPELFASLAGDAPEQSNHAAGMAWLLDRCLAAYRAGSQTASNQLLHPAVRRAAALLCQTPSPESLADLAAAVNVSPAWLSRIFQRQLAVSITDFRNQQRLQRFLRLAGAPSADFSQCALRAGFNSYAQFYRIFIKQMHLSPREWKTGVAQDQYQH